jgi:hypothetical protein
MAAVVDRTTASSKEQKYRAPLKLMFCGVAITLYDGVVPPATGLDPMATAKVYPLFVPEAKTLSMKQPLLVEGTQVAPTAPPK